MEIDLVISIQPMNVIGDPIFLSISIVGIILIIVGILVIKYGGINGK